ncbi:hypothetical protein F907_01606 [Acinetobacter colistiniresistens]|uniref:DUF3139 domain-containing protein n=2 Tax=Acinetobacter colistiniresistens TaxID=280145 RepID=S3T7X4_9GAMM|nr:hypothetical protein [Acinetobacter colistiniresistens]EPG37636.1 hypothetical protein F907_01606 [Acinetobacter colistiniresistens]TVT85480.1 hypothetical protein FPV60_04180 [Acinetobacter colistiniresistens]
MKLNVKKILTFLVLAICLAYFSTYMTNKDYKKNERNIAQIFQHDTELHEKYGTIENYKLRKSGWYSGDSQDHTPYYYYHFYIKGNRKDGVIELKIYENQEKYAINYIQ